VSHIDEHGEGMFPALHVSVTQ